MAASMANIEIKDIPQAGLKADPSDICFERMMGSSAIEVKTPLTIASTMIGSVDQEIPVI